MRNSILPGWIEKPLDSLVDIQKGRLVPYQPFAKPSSVPCIGVSSFDGKYDNFTEAQNGVFCVPSDVLMLWDGERSGLCSIGLEGVIGSTVARLRPRSEIDARFLYYKLQAEYQFIQTQRTGTGVPHVAKDLPKILKIFYPKNVEEQRRIAAILDAADETIRVSERVIAKLRQVKAGLLHDLLTLGVDAQGRLRDPQAHPEQFQASPLGRIPREWEVLQLTNVARRITSGSRGWAAYYVSQGPLFLRIGNLTRDHINLRLDNVVHVQPPMGAEVSRTAVEAGDLLISVTADLGIIGVIPPDFGEAYVNQHIALVKLEFNKVNPRWVGTYLAGSLYGQMQFRRLNDMGAKAGMNLQAVGALFVPSPSLREQGYITAILDAHDARLRAEEAVLAKLRRVKAGLMDDLLTGRVRSQAL